MTQTALVEIRPCNTSNSRHNTDNSVRLCAVSLLHNHTAVAVSKSGSLHRVKPDKFRLPNSINLLNQGGGGLLKVANAVHYTNRNCLDSQRCFVFRFAPSKYRFVTTDGLWVG